LLLALVSVAPSSVVASHVPEPPQPGTHELATLRPSDPSDAGFGYAVDVDGGVIVVGAAGVPWKPTTNGSAYVFRSSGGAWLEEARLVGTSTNPCCDRFGGGVDVSGDALAVGAPGDDGAAGNGGAVYVFRRVGPAWVQEAKLTVDDASELGSLGRDVAISGDVVAAAATGAVYIFRKQAGGWVQERKLVVNDALGRPFGGQAVDVAASGDRIAIGAPYFTLGGFGYGQEGLVIVYRYDGTSWISSVLAASDRIDLARFGSSVDMSGDALLATAPGVDTAYVFRFEGSGWTEEAMLQAEYPGNPGFIATPAFGAVAGDTTITVAFGLGYVFRGNASGWSEEAVLRSSGEQECMPSFEAVAADGDVVVLGNARYCNEALVYGPRCNDGADQDGDALVDLADPGCGAALDFSEQNPLAPCDDGADNDGDSWADASDAGCAGPNDPSEQDPEHACDNGLDDDGDGRTDFADPGCVDPADPSERGGECDNGLDDDGDGLADYPADPGCVDLADGAERELFLRVDSTVDGYDATPGDGVCADATGACTLHAAIGEANRWPGPDEVEIPEGTYTIADGLYLADAVTLRGAGADRTIIEHGNAFPFFGDTVAVEASAAIRDLTIRGSQDGSGVSCGWGCDLELRRVAVMENAVYGAYTNGVLRVHDSAIHGNGLTGLVVQDPGRLELINSTVSGNQGGVSAALCFFCTPCGPWCPPPATLRIENSTISDNTGAGIFFPGSPVRNTLVTGNEPDCLFSSIASLGHNLDSDGSCGLTDPTDLSNVDPLLGPLQHNGGPTPTHALLPGSLALDAIPPADCVYDDDGDPATPEVALTTDQRGAARPRDGDGVAPTGCDIGSYEEAPPCSDGPDQDGDGMPDACDDCTLVANADQRDSNGDGYGNLCDADLDQDGTTNLADLALFRARFLTTDPHADLDGSGSVNLLDLALFRQRFLRPPGPSGLAP
jgi:hypothetical protein